MSNFVKARNHLSNFKRHLKARSASSSPFFSNRIDLRYVLLVDSRNHVNMEESYIYTRIPKAANSTIIGSLYAQEGRSLSRDELEFLKHGKKKLSQLSKNEIVKIENQYFIFTFIRNPIARFLSCYKDKIARKSVYSRLVSRLHLGIDNCILSMDQFLDFLETDENLYRDAHWSPQSSIMAFPIDRYDFIGCVENLDADLRHVLDRLGMKGEHSSYKRHGTGALSNLDALSVRQVQRISKLYVEDFEQFGYSEVLDNAQKLPRIRSL